MKKSALIFCFSFFTQIVFSSDLKPINLAPAWSAFLLQIYIQESLAVRNNCISKTEVLHGLADGYAGTKFPRVDTRSPLYKGRPEYEVAFGVWRR